MKVFISWSGERSHAVAEGLQTWLRRVIQSVEPWLSSEMTKGVRWSTEVAARLEESKVGIFCLTPENLTEPWILFEAGAVSKTKDAYVCTLLLDLNPADVEPPLGQFQHTTVTKQDILRLVRSINSAVAGMGEKGVPENDLEEVFQTWWPRLNDDIGRAATLIESARPAARDQREILEELLELAREQERRFVALRGVTLQENALYAMKNGALRPIKQLWQMRDGRWQVISEDLSEGAALGIDYGFNLPPGMKLPASEERAPDGGSPQPGSDDQ